MNFIYFFIYLFVCLFLEGANLIGLSPIFLTTLGSPPKYRSSKVIPFGPPIGIISLLVNEGCLFVLFVLFVQLRSPKPQCLLPCSSHRWKVLNE
jgi:hypothetical protein